MNLLARLDADGFIEVTISWRIPLSIPDGHVVLAEPLRFSVAPTPTSRARPLLGGSVEWVETGPLEGLKAAAIARTYPDVDSVYLAAVGNREPEYTEAEAVARAYLAAESKPIPVSEYITGHALNNPTGQIQSEAWAAQQIVERADAFRWAKLQMRNVRFARQADMRAATTPEELAAAVASWSDFITWLRATLGL